VADDLLAQAFDSFQANDIRRLKQWIIVKDIGTAFIEAARHWQNSRRPSLRYIVSMGEV
jgi:hypothetical protein